MFGVVSSGIFPLSFLVLLAGIRISDIKQVNRRKLNKSLITHIHGRDPRKPSKSPKQAETLK